MKIDIELVNTDGDAARVIPVASPTPLYSVAGFEYWILLQFLLDLRKLTFSLLVLLHPVASPLLHV